jgi:hypothetical protein
VVVLVCSSCLPFYSVNTWHFANLICCRLLRARLPYQRRYDLDHHHQRYGGGHYLAGQEWENSVLGFQGVDGLGLGVSLDRVIINGVIKLSLRFHEVDVRNCNFLVSSHHHQ